MAKQLDILRPEQGDIYTGNLVLDEDMIRDMQASESGIVVYDDGTVGIGHITATKTGLVFDGDVSEAEWSDYGHAIVRFKNSLQWLAGDFVLYGLQHEYGQVAEFADLLDRDPQTIYNWAWVCKNVTLSRRRESLSFGHHEVVASLPPEKQEQWLAIAENTGKKSLSVNQFRKLLNGQIRNVPKLDKFTKFDLKNKEFANEVESELRSSTGERRTQLLEYAENQAAVWSMIFKKYERRI